MEDTLDEFEVGMVSVAFSFGYLFGQMFDVPDPKIQKDLEAVKILMKEKKLLTYLPRERKAA